MIDVVLDNHLAQSILPLFHEFSFIVGFARSLLGRSLLAAQIVVDLVDIGTRDPLNRCLLLVIINQISPLYFLGCISVDAILLIIFSNMVRGLNEIHFAHGVGFHVLVESQLFGDSSLSGSFDHIRLVMILKLLLSIRQNGFWLAGLFHAIFLVIYNYAFILFLPRSFFDGVVGIFSGGVLLVADVDGTHG